MKKSALKDHSQICLIFVLGHFVDKHSVFWVWCYTDGGGSLLVRPVEILTDHGEEFSVVRSKELTQNADHFIRHLSPNTFYARIFQERDNFVFASILLPEDVSFLYCR